MEPLELPLLLLNNASLVRLDFCHYQFDPNKRVKWECLKILELEDCSLSYRGIENALSGAPLLETLELRNCNWHEMVIASKSLRKVTLCDTKSTTAQVLCPKLQEFTCMYSMLCGEVIQNISGSPLLEYVELHHFSMFGREQLAISSKSLKKVILCDIMSTVAQILCPNLRELACTECMFCDEVFQNISSWSPSLESLKLDNCSMLGLEQLAISFESLKRLVLYSSFYDRVRILLFQIVCPKLEELQLSGWDFLPSAIVNLPSLICAILDFRYHTSGVENSLEKLQHVKELTISHTSLKVLSNTIMARRSSPFLTNSLILELNRLDDSHHGIVWVLQKFRILEKLAIKLYPDNGECVGLFEALCQYVRSYFSRNYWDSYNTISGYLALHLRILKIIGFSKRNGQCKLALNLIEFLWKNCRALEKVVVVMSNYCDAKFRSGVYRKLLGFGRYNNHVTVELLQETEWRW